MYCARFHTRPDQDVLSDARMRAVTDGNGVEYTVPASWDAAAVGLALEKFFSPHPVPAATRPVPETGVPDWLQRREALPGAPDSPETDIRAVLRRLAGGWTYRAWKTGTISCTAEARAFHDEILFLLLHRHATPETAIWAELGLDWFYGLPEYVLAHEHATAPPAPARDALKHFDITARQNALDGRSSAVLLRADDSGSAAFIRWKRDAASETLARNIGLRALRGLLHRVMDACDRDDAVTGFDPHENLSLARAVAEARQAGLDDSMIEAAISYARQGYESIPLPRPGEDEASPADSVSCILSVPDAFVESAITGQGVMLMKEGLALHRASAEALWESLSESVWAAGEPRVLFEDHARAATPLSQVAASEKGGFVFLPGETAPMAVLDAALPPDALSHAAAVMTAALDTLAEGRLRPVLLNLTNVAGALMQHVLAYESDAGRATAAMLAALVSGRAHLASARLAEAAGACAGYAPMEKNFQAAIRAKMGAFAPGGWQGRSARAMPENCPDQDLVKTARDIWAEAYVALRAAGIRNAHLTGIAAASDAQVFMNAASGGIAPLAQFVEIGDGDAYGRRLNPRVSEALHSLGHTAAEIDDIHFYALGHGTLLDAPHINHKTLQSRGFTTAALDAVEAALRTARHIRDAINIWTLGADFCRRILPPDEEADDLLAALDFTEEEIAAANLYACGAMTLTGAPHIEAQSAAVFAARATPTAQLRMQAATETFLSGAATHTILLGREDGVDTVEKILLQAWESGLKTVSVHRAVAGLAPAQAVAAAQSDAKQDNDNIPRKTAS